MVYVISAYRIDSKTFIPGFSFGEKAPLVEEFTKLMGVPKTVTKKVYTEAQLRQFRKVAVNIITDAGDRRLVKNFLTACIDEAKGSNIDVLFR